MSVDFSSWPREQEQSFVVYEQTNQAAQKLAWTVGGVVAGVFFLASLGIYMGVAPEHKDISKDMNMSNLTKKEGKDAKAPAPEAEKK